MNGLDERIRVILSDTTIELEQTRRLLKLSRLKSQQKSQSITAEQSNYANATAAGKSEN